MEALRNPDFPVSHTSGPIDSIHFGLALTIVHQAPHQYLTFIWGQKATVCWPICKPPIHEDAHEDSETSFNDEYPILLVRVFASN